MNIGLAKDVRVYNLGTEILHTKNDLHLDEDIDAMQYQYVSIDWS